MLQNFQHLSCRKCRKLCYVIFVILHKPSQIVSKKYHLAAISWHLGRLLWNNFSLISGPKVQLCKRAKLSEGSMITPKPCSGIASDTSMGMDRLKNRFFSMKVKDPDIIYFNIGNWKYLKRTYKILYIYIIHLEDRFAKEVTAAKSSWASHLICSSFSFCFFVNGTVTHLHMKS